ncbi:hypothetical protein, partial [Treponema sp. R6D11]
NGHTTKLDEKDKLHKSDYFCDKKISKDFKYFLELNELCETNYTFQEIIKTKWVTESVINLEMLNKDKVFTG